MGVGAGLPGNCVALTEIRVPAASVEEYKQASGWNNYSIVAIPEP